MAPLIVMCAITGGLVLLSASTPIAGRGDYGQWLMTSRYYLGQEVPDYRTISALPPVIPVLMAGIRLVVPDPVLALGMVGALLIVGLALAFYAAGNVVLDSPLGGVLSVAVGLLVTDRFLELFAFGGLLQAASVTCMCLSVAAFVRAGRGPGVQGAWWLAGSISLALAALSHVGTGAIAVPTGLGVALLSALRLRIPGWRGLLHAGWPLALSLSAVGAYWLVVLLPASGDYVSNPASLDYRGPDRLLSALGSYWPTTVVMALGASALVAGALGEMLRRTVGGYVVLLAWAAMAWGALGFSVVTGASTDYPRFATVLLPPLVLASAGALLWLAGALAAQLHAVLPRSAPSDWRLASVMALVLVATPFAVTRYANQMNSYRPLDAGALTAAVAWVDAALGDSDAAVLTAVRDGKWLEGLTGRDALFSQPVRYAFRPAEWQRSIEAETLLRSVAALTNEFFFLKFTETDANGPIEVPSSLLLGVNHGGEFVDLLHLTPSHTQIMQRGVAISSAGLAPLEATRTLTTADASIRTAWGPLGESHASFVRTVRLWKDGAALGIIDEALEPGLQTDLYPPLGIAFTVLDIRGREARACFTRLGDEEPCLRIWVAQSDATMETTADGGLRIRTQAEARLSVYVTALTAGDASVSLTQLDPMELVAKHDLGAAILLELDPAFDSRLRRLEAIGFHLARSFGPYAVLVRDSTVQAKGP